MSILLRNHSIQHTDIAPKKSAGKFALLDIFDKVSNLSGTAESGVMSVWLWVSKIITLDGWWEDDLSLNADSHGLTRFVTVTNIMNPPMY